MPKDNKPKINSVQKLDFSRSNAERIEEILQTQDAVRLLCNDLIFKHQQNNDEVVGFLFDLMCMFREAKYEEEE